MKLALAQLEPRSRNLDFNVATVCETLRSQTQSDLILFPEFFLGGYQLTDVDELAIDPEGPELNAIREAAAEASCAAVIGAALRRPSGVADSAVCVDEAGEIASIYDKTHLFGEEADSFIAGRSLQPATLGDRRIGLMICFDVEFPEVPRTLARRGADVLVTISANMTPFELDHDVFVPARAIENGLPHLYVNRTGEESGISFVGGSRAVDQEGNTVAILGRDPGILDVEMDLTPGRRDPRTRYAQYLRAELYSEDADSRSNETEPTQTTGSAR